MDYFRCNNKANIIIFSLQISKILLVFLLFSSIPTTLLRVFTPEAIAVPEAAESVIK